MFSIWFFLWLILSGTLLYFFGWTLFIILRQKKAWRIFAEKKKLRYSSSSLFQVPEIKGSLEGYTISVFASEHVSNDMRSSRKLTAIEVNLSSIMPIEGGIASGGMVPIVQNLNLKAEYVPDSSHWSKSNIAAGESKKGLEVYLNEERTQALDSLMKIKNAWVIFIFRGNVTLLRLDTPDPLDSPEKLNAITKKMLEVAKILELKPGEDKLIKAESLKKSEKEVSLEIQDKDMAVNFQFEEDEGT